MPYRRRGRAQKTDNGAFRRITRSHFPLQRCPSAALRRDPKTSMLNGNNQLHACPNVFVTDGACMTSTGNQNPSLTYMALTARAANIAVEQMKRGEL